MSRYQWKTGPEAIVAVVQAYAGNTLPQGDLPAQGLLAEAAREAAEFGFLKLEGERVLSVTEAGRSILSAKDPVGFVLSYTHIWLSEGVSFQELDLLEVLYSKFNAGEGVVALRAETSDVVILATIRHALSYGKPFTVVPAHFPAGQAEWF